MTTEVQRRWLSKQEAADYINVSLTTLRRLTEAGKLHVSKPTDAKYRSPVCYDVRDLDAYMESRRVGGPSRDGE